MTDIEELEAKVRDLPTEKLAIFRDWFYQFENDMGQTNCNRFSGWKTQPAY